MTDSNVFIYYYDRVKIHSSIHHKALSQLIDTEEFKGHCKNIVISKANDLLKMRGYYGKIELSQATDEAIKILQKYDIHKHVISYAEFARDRICFNHFLAMKLKQIFVHSRYVKYTKGMFSIEGTDYLAKIKGKKKNLYVRCYIPEPDNIKLGNKVVVHVEFTLHGWRTISSRLGISSIYDLTTAEQCYRILEDKYLVKGTLNHTRIEKHFPESEARYINEFIPELLFRKLVIWIKKNRIIAIRRWRGIVLPGLSRSDKMISNQGAKYWINEDENSGGRI